MMKNNHTDVTIDSLNELLLWHNANIKPIEKLIDVNNRNINKLYEYNQVINGVIYSLIIAWIALIIYKLYKWYRKQPKTLNIHIKLPRTFKKIYLVTITSSVLLLSVLLYSKNYIHREIYNVSDTVNAQHELINTLSDIHSNEMTIYNRKHKYIIK
jgi:CHASE3 domain sensor protein